MSLPPTRSSIDPVVLAPINRLPSFLLREVACFVGGAQHWFGCQQQPFLAGQVRTHYDHSYGRVSKRWRRELAWAQLMPLLADSGVGRAALENPEGHPPTVVVTPSADFPDLEYAVAAVRHFRQVRDAGAGTPLPHHPVEIRLRAGVHRISSDNLEVGPAFRGVRVVGAGKDHTCVCGPGFLWVRDMGEGESFCLEHVHMTRTFVRVQGDFAPSTVRLTSCTISDSECVGVEACGEHAVVDMQNCVVSRHEQHGVVARGGGTVRIRGAASRIHGNQGYGIYAGVDMAFLVDDMLEEDAEYYATQAVEVVVSGLGAGGEVLFSHTDTEPNGDEGAFQNVFTDTWSQVRFDHAGGV